MLNANTAKISSVTHVPEKRKKTAKPDAQLPQPPPQSLAKKELSGARMVLHVHAILEHLAARTTVLSATNQKRKSAMVLSFINVLTGKMKSSATHVKSQTMTAKTNVQKNQKKKNVSVVSFIIVPMEKTPCFATDVHSLTRTVKPNAQLTPIPMNPYLAN